jgi:hypothetical protein
MSGAEQHGQVILRYAAKNDFSPTCYELLCVAG